MTQHPYHVLLYYCFTPIDNPELFRTEHHKLCLDLDLRGRIIIAAEGLNGTVSGAPAACEAYMQAVKADPRFATIDFKLEGSDVPAFAKLNVRVKSEIVHAGLPDIKPWQRTGVHVDAAQFKAMKDQEDVVILDVRSNYEHHLGKFKNAITLDIENFREFPDKVEDLAHLKSKKVITYCTGGIKCEKASAFLLAQGFENVYQLHGGIIKYGIEGGGEDFEGLCYTFDNRMAVEVNSVNPKVISTCIHCGTTTPKIVNCANTTCNIQMMICEDCGWTHEGCCSEACKGSEHKRPYDGTGYYSKEQNGYNPYIGFRNQVLAPH